MSTCRDIASYFIVRSYEDGREAEITNMKVQKLLYYAQSLHLAFLEFPWKKARKGLPASAASREPIALEDMKALGYQKLEEIEFNHPVYKPLVAEVLEQAFRQESTVERVQKGGIHDWLTSLLD